MAMTDSEKLAKITAIVDRNLDEQNDDDGDKYLSDPNYALEAIDAVLSDNTGNPILRSFLGESR